MAGIAKGEITFYRHWLPALGPGKYEVSVKPELTVTVTAPPNAPGGQPDTALVTESFYVAGPRFSLTGSEPYSCYPAPGQVGSFDDTLPHIVFDRRTLPWERTIEADGDPSDETKNYPPWLALILLSASDFPEKVVPRIEEREVATLTDKTDSVRIPSLELAEYEKFLGDGSMKAMCQTIDLPAHVFGKVMPSLAELPYLAHIREVKTDAKETWSLLKEGFFSVVVCNRFPETQGHNTELKADRDWGVMNTACLVSLEGWGAHLTNPVEQTNGMTDSFRVVVLGSWRFTCQGVKDFKSLMTAIDCKRAFSLPLKTAADPDKLPEPKNFDDIVDAAFSVGFAAVNHDLRYHDPASEDQLISWYRGPLVPILYDRRNYGYISCADAALYYDPASGMFNTEYAAAWQLGRLLALQDHAFAQSLYRYRTSYERWARKTNAKALLSEIEKLDQDATKFGTNDDIGGYYRTVFGYVGWRDDPNKSGETSEEAPKIPVEVQNWLGQAMLLYGVPFQYLVPDENMLEPESIRFFAMNPDWISCLLQGACSVGRASATDELSDQLLRARFFDISERVAFGLRKSAKKMAEDRLKPVADQNKPPPDPEGVNESDPNLKLNWPLTGFLLRSAAVEAWIGLESRAEGKNLVGDPLTDLQLLRMDRLAPDILLCIFNGRITRFEIKQPQEAIHFGASPTGAEHEKTLRNISGPEPELGKIMTDKKIDRVPMRGSRVVDVCALAVAIQEKLGAPLTSAEFAAEMIESPARVVFTAPET